MVRIGNHESLAMDGMSIHIVHKHQRSMDPHRRADGEKVRENVLLSLVSEQDMAIIYDLTALWSHTQDFHKTERQKIFKDGVEKGSRCPNPDLVEKAS